MDVDQVNRKYFVRYDLVYDCCCGHVSGVPGRVERITMERFLEWKEDIRDFKAWPIENPGFHIHPEYWKEVIRRHTE